MGETKYINEKLPKEQRLGQVGCNNKGEEMIIIALYGKGGYVDVKFTDDGSICKHISYSNFNKGGVKHPIRYDESFAYYIIEELQKDLNDIWNWEVNNKNEVNPYEITKYSKKNIYLYCEEYDYHNYDMNGNKIGYKTTPAEFTRGRRCIYNSTHNVHWKDSIGYLYPDIAKRINIPENDIDIYSTSPYSSKKVYEKCSECGEISQNKKTIKAITRNETSCWNCSDSISTPNKILRQIAKQLNLNWIFEYTESWMNGCRFDAYDVDLKQPIEMDAPYINNHKGKRKEIDDWKDKEAIKHGMKRPVRINLMDIKQYKNNKFEYIKKEVSIALGCIYNLDNFNWELAWKESQKSLPIEALKLYKEGYKIKEIAKILNVYYCTVSVWLKELGIKNQYEIAKEKRFQIKEMLIEGKTTNDIINKVHTSVSTIKKVRKEIKEEQKLFYTYVE